MTAKLRLDQYGVWIHARGLYVRKKQGKIDARQAAILDRRRVVRKAYFLIRRDPDKRDLTLEFARALGGTIELTDAILKQAATLTGE